MNHPKRCKNAKVIDGDKNIILEISKKKGGNTVNRSEESQYSDNSIDIEDDDTQKDKYLTFHVGSEDYGIQIENVTEIIRMQKIADLPNVPDYVKGVINLRGKVIPVIDMRKRFEIEERDYDDRTCIIVVGINGMMVGLVVDSVNEVVDIPGEEIVPPPQTVGQESEDFIKGFGKIGSEVKILLDVEKVLVGSQEANNISA